MWWKKISLLLALIAVPIVVTAQEPPESPRAELTFVMPCLPTTDAEKLYRENGRTLIYEGSSTIQDFKFQLWSYQDRWFILLRLPKQDATCLLIHGDELKLKSTI